MAMEPFGATQPRTASGSENRTSQATALASTASDLRHRVHVPQHQVSPEPPAQRQERSRFTARARCSPDPGWCG